jgi:Uma2 family endonuclease
MTSERRPDVSFVSAVRRLPPQTDAWAIVPDLAIEVINPTNRASHTLQKLNEYLLAGVQRVWIVYPREAEIHVYDASEPGHSRRLMRGDTLEAESQIPGFRLPLAELFPEKELVDEPKAG